MLKLAGKHPNVVTMQAFFEDHDAYYIVMEMCQGGELFNQVAHKVRSSLSCPIIVGCAISHCTRSRLSDLIDR